MAQDYTHTPGPWDYDMDFIVAPDPDGRHPDLYIAEIAHRDEEGRIASPQQQDANRRLIAAAPELLEALHQITVGALRDIVGAADNGESYGREELVSLFIADCDTADEAIAKATTGHSPTNY